MQLTSPSDTTSKQGRPPAAEFRRPILLVVDDEEGPRQSLKIVFKTDYEVMLATDGKSALEIIRTHDVSVAILDILMAGMSGIELLAEMKEVRPNIGVIMLTAYETLETARHAIRYGACDYLNKPFDITAMRSAVARALEKSRLAQSLSATDEKLNALQQEIQDQKLQQEIIRTKGEIYASVLHDINSPLTVISGYVEMINEAIRDAASVEGEQLEIIKDDLGKLTGQVTRCFEISRRYLSFLHNNSSGERARVGINQILADMKELLTRHPSASGNKLTICECGGDVIADINGTDLLQILLNLTLNALQCTEQPHIVDVRCEKLTEPLDLGQFTDGPTDRFINREGFLNKAPLLVLSIQDSGPGIPARIMPKMFEEKFTTKPADKGTGLGLSIVRRLIKEAGGAIRLQTQPGFGTKFTICLQTWA
jgi:two-component system sensor histidine kinase/response regulator